MLNNKGMTLIEVVVSIVILSIILLAVGTGFAASLRQDVSTAQYQKISDEIKIEIDNWNHISGTEVTVDVVYNNNVTKTVKAKKLILTSDEESSISFARYDGYGIE